MNKTPLLKSVYENQNVSEIVFIALAENEIIDDITISEHAEIFIKWDDNFRTEKRGIIVQAPDGKLYSNIHPVMDSAQNVNPIGHPEMWRVRGNPEAEWPDWSQPLGAHDAYSKDDKVNHNGKRWVSNFVGANVWEPGVYGWIESNS